MFKVKLKSILLLSIIVSALFTYPSRAAGALTAATEQDTLPQSAALELSAEALTPYLSLPYYKPENTERYINYCRAYPDVPPETVITHVNIGLDRPFYSNPVLVENPGDISVLVNKYHQLPPDHVPAKLETINDPYRYGMQQLTREARVAFEKMCAVATKAGYPFWAVSSYRSYDRQAEIYDSFYDPDDADTIAKQDLIAARPGFSEHQTGLSVDISRVNADVASADISSWLEQYACRYGFIIRYPKGKEDVTGYMSEPWHLRYLGPELACAVFKSRLSYEEYYTREIDIESISGDAIAVSAEPTIVLKGAEYPLTAYRIGGTDYFRLGDLAAIFKDTPLMFDIDQNSSQRQIALLTGVPYTAEAQPQDIEAVRAVVVALRNSAIMNGKKEYLFESFSHTETNYFKLNDILSLWNAAAYDNGKGTLTVVLPRGTPPCNTLIPKI